MMITINKEQKFPFGRVVATPGALAALAGAGETPGPYLARHGAGDWGTVCADDAALNDQALIDGDRVLSAYELGDKTRLWIITECDRSATTLLLPEEW